MNIFTVSHWGAMEQQSPNTTRSKVYYLRDAAGKDSKECKHCITRGDPVLTGRPEGLVCCSDGVMRQLVAGRNGVVSLTTEKRQNTNVLTSLEIDYNGTTMVVAPTEQILRQYTTPVPAKDPKVNSLTLQCVTVPRTFVT